MRRPAQRQASAGEDARRRLAAEQERLADRTQRLGESVKQLADGGAQPDEKQAMTEAGRELDRQNLAGRMRESAQAMRQGQPGEQQQSGAAGEIARALDKVADELGAAGERDAETSRLSDQLSRAQELRDRLGRLQRTMEELKDQGAQGAQSAQAQPGADGKEGGTGQQGSSAGGRDGKLSQLQREADSQMREAQKLAEDMQRENPGMQKGGSTPEQWQRSVSAPGTEGFKQDFANWESLKNNLLVALDRTESQLSDQLRARENRERLNAGRHDAVADSYKALVDRYYQSLAAPRRRIGK
jgi:DNA repair exonuclease SbcCD ATPase subunit